MAPSNAISYISIFSTFLIILNNNKLVFGNTTNCREYKQCIRSLPKDYYNCAEIREAWKYVSGCLAAAHCHGDLYATGLIIGRCEASYDTYVNHLKCGLDEDVENFPKDSLHLCGVANKTTFIAQYTSENLLNIKRCDYLYPTSCDATRMHEYRDCINAHIDNNFIKGVMVGACEYFSHRGQSCNFGLETCGDEISSSPSGNSSRYMVAYPPLIMLLIFSFFYML